MTCTVDKRQQVRRAADALQAVQWVVDADVLPPAKSQYDAWTLDAVVRHPEGIPPEVLRELPIHDLTQRAAPDRGEYRSLVATA